MLLARLGLHIGSGLLAGPRQAESRVPRGERVDRRVQQQGRATVRRPQDTPSVGRIRVKPPGAAPHAGRVEHMGDLGSQVALLSRRRRRGDKHLGEFAQATHRDPGERVVERGHGCRGGRTEPTQVPVVLVRSRTSSRFAQETALMDGLLDRRMHRTAHSDPAPAQRDSCRVGDAGAVGLAQESGDY